MPGVKIKPASGHVFAQTCAICQRILNSLHKNLRQKWLGDQRPMPVCLRESLFGVTCEKDNSPIARRQLVGDVEYVSATQIHIQERDIRIALVK